MPRNRSTPWIAATAATLSLLAAGACSGPDGDAPKAQDAPRSTAAKPFPATSVKVADSGLGRILVDGTGRTLYAFTQDRPGTGTCAADCVAAWPALTSTRPVTAGPGTRPALLTRTAHTTGAEQAVYGDWPLYYYVGDALPGDTNGQGVDGEWFTLAADGNLIRTPA
ncbi:hypothetical protein [Streptomyces clavuligerus]|nr:hypothetical protein [Streptomyces clavuligerus]WDN52079.1 hypothetical protein LL058_09600 [Streptomyces clavuligerus]